jgi:hypothetical protein
LLKIIILLRIMTPEENDNNEVDKESSNGKDDLETYLEEMEALKSDFSDLEELDIEEINAMQQAIAKVQEMESKLDNAENPVDKANPEITLNAEINNNEYSANKEALMMDFSDLEEIDLDELMEMKEAIESVKSEMIPEETSKPVLTGGISSDLEDKIKEELEQRKEEKKEDQVTPEKFVQYTLPKRDKIWYHVLHYLVYQAEDHIASKELLYDMLKEVTSKNPLDPIPEHQFYFGLGYILRLTLNDKQIVRYISGGKFKINIAVKILKEMLDEIGEPISTRPVIEEDERQRMYKAFLKDDFLDI